MKCAAMSLGMMLASWLGTLITAPAVSQADDQAKRIAELVGQLGSEEVAVREKASGELLKIGKPAVEALRKATESQDVEVKARARILLDKIKVLKVDDQGRVLVERTDGGWNLEYRRDEFGNVIQKTWVNPHDPKETLVRLFSYEIKSGRLVEEVDHAGRKKRIHYGEDGKIERTLVEDGFTTEAEQVSRMLPPSKKEPGSPPDSHLREKKAEEK